MKNRLNLTVELPRNHYLYVISIRKLRQIRTILCIDLLEIHINNTNQLVIIAYSISCLFALITKNLVH